MAILQAYRDEQAHVRETAAEQWQENDLVCCDDLGRPLDYNRFYIHHRRLVKTLGLPPTLRPHDLRHMHASHLLEQGVPVSGVQQRLGHASPGFTLSVYGHVLPGSQQEAAERFAASLNGHQELAIPVSRQQTRQQTERDESPEDLNGSFLNSETGEVPPA